MWLILLFLTVVAFVLFFYGIGLWYLWFVPFVFLVILIAYYTTRLSIKDKTMQLLEKNGILIAWLVFLWWLVWVFHFVGIGSVVIAKLLFGLNLILWFVSYLISYKDGKIVFQVGYYWSLLFLFITTVLWATVSEIIDIFTLLRSLHIGILAFFIFIIGIKHKIEDYMRYKLLVLLVGVLVLLVIEFTSDIYLALFLNSWILMLIYFVTHKLNQVKWLSTSKQENISLRRILAWEKILSHNKIKTPQSPLLLLLARFVHEMPKFAKYMLEFINIILVALLIVVYISWIGEPVSQTHQILFWLTIVLFTWNVILLKKLWFTSFIQKLVVFTVINFAIYVSLFTFFDMQFGQIAIRWIVRNIVSSLAIFYTPKTSLAKVFLKRDYMYRIWTTLIALLINIILLSKAQIEGQLVFSLIFLYVGLEWMILFYAMKYIRKLHE